MGFLEYLKDTRAERRHVAWPTQFQTVVYTILVVAISIFVSLYLGFFDFLFTGMLQRAVGAGGVTVSQPASTTNPITVTPVFAPTSTKE